MGKKAYPTSDSQYRLMEEVGYGASATVYRAICLPFNEVVAVKCLDLERCNSNLDDIRREAQTMSLIDHPNVIRAYCSFVVDRHLWVVMPFMSEGSCLHIMKIAYPDGFEEAIIASILKETLKALEYLHRQGHIHRDVKAGNILVDTSGSVKLGDFGVSACMFDTGDRQRSRNTFVGTPCWMAPEVLQPGSGYDFKADIWSLGITALELAHGHAPFSKYPPMKVLLMTIQNAPPGLDYDRDKKFSKSFKEMIAMCLVKDQTKRPTAEKLLKHSFFKQAKPPEHAVRYLFQGLPPLWERVKILKNKDAQQPLKKMPFTDEEAKSQEEYKRGVSAWNFDLEDLKCQAALIQDDDYSLGGKEDDDAFQQTMVENQSTSLNAYKKEPEKVQLGNIPLVRSSSINDISGLETFEYANGKADMLINEAVTDFEQLKANEKEQFNARANGRQKYDGNPYRTQDIEVLVSKNKSPHRQCFSGPLANDRILVRNSERVIDNGRDKNGQRLEETFNHDLSKDPILAGPLMLPNRASANSFSAPMKPSGGFKEYQDDRSRANLIQKKGRFSVTSENLDTSENIQASSANRRSQFQSIALRKSASVGDWLSEQRQGAAAQIPKDSGNSTIPVGVLASCLQNLLQQNVNQQEQIVNLMTSIYQAEGNNSSQNSKRMSSPLRNGGADFLTETAEEREQNLLAKISELQSKVQSLADELNVVKMRSLEIREVVDNCERITKFIYGHGILRSLFLRHSKGKEISRLGATRFATHFLSLRSLLDARVPLGFTFISEEWTRNDDFLRLCISIEGVDVASLVKESHYPFWSTVEEVVKLQQQLNAVSNQQERSAKDHKQ